MYVVFDILDWVTHIGEVTLRYDDGRRDEGYADTDAPGRRAFISMGDWTRYGSGTGMHEALGLYAGR